MATLYISFKDGQSISSSFESKEKAECALKDKLYNERGDGKWFSYTDDEGDFTMIFWDCVEFIVISDHDDYWSKKCGGRF